MIFKQLIGTGPTGTELRLDSGFRSRSSHNSSWTLETYA